MSGASINISDRATPFLEKMHATLAEREDIMGEIGASVQNLCRDYVIAQQPDRHETAFALGGDPTGFLGFAAEAIEVQPPSPDEVVINFNHAWFSRVGHDVDIYPGDGHKYLAIPISGESYGKRLQGNFPGGFFFHSKNGGLFYGTKIEGHENYLSPLYVLVTEVHQPQDRGRLPDDDAITHTAVDAMSRGAIERLNLTNEILEGN
jgi:hypothetical protein